MPGNHHWTINKNFSKRAQYGFPYLYHFPTCIPVHMWTIESIRTSMSNNLKTNPFTIVISTYKNYHYAGGTKETLHDFIVIRFRFTR